MIQQDRTAQPHGVRWGVVATIKADRLDVLNFAAWHLEQGAEQLFLYLDAPDIRTRRALAAHPRILAYATHDAYWAKRGGRPEMHQERQIINALHAYRARTGC